MADPAQSELHELDEQRSAIERLVQFEPKGNRVDTPSDKVVARQRDGQ